MRELAATLIENLLFTNQSSWPNTFPNLVVDEESEENNIALVRRAIGRMTSYSRAPCMIAIDQWNAVIFARKGSLYQELFGSFDRIRPVKGACYLAVSSSFSFPLNFIQRC